MIIECPLNGQFHDCRDVIITSRMAVSFLVNNGYYDEQKSRNVIIMESEGLEMTMSEK